MINTDDLISLSWEQKKKYRAAIAYGYFDNYEDNPRQWKHSLVGAFLWRYPHRTATLNRLKDLVGHIPQWAITLCNIGTGSTYPLPLWCYSRNCGYRVTNFLTTSTGSPRRRA